MSHALAVRHACFVHFIPLDTGTDDVSADEKVRNASRNFRQTFDLPTTERLVNCKTPYFVVFLFFLLLIRN
ncbi:hypothetical protein BC940DRAFT_236132 [Gongronella butleri]|nr:hypothetical protein BC940DRAFT_236132 [Gongronella butleri]